MHGCRAGGTGYPPRRVQRLAAHLAPADARGAEGGGADELRLQVEAQAREIAGLRAQLSGQSQKVKFAGLTQNSQVDPAV